MAAQKTDVQVLTTQGNGKASEIPSGAREFLSKQAKGSNLEVLLNNGKLTDTDISEMSGAIQGFDEPEATEL